MAENRSRFIKTVTFGGYERTEVDKRLEALYSQVYDLKNELRESKLMLEKFRKGTEEEEAHESVLAVERAKITEMQVKNETMSDKVKRTEEENKLMEKELTSLREENEKLKTELEEANSELSALRTGGDAAGLGTVFIEAQKSRNMLLSTAQDEAAKMKADSEKFAENIIADADNKAAMIIYEAEKRAAVISAEALAKSDKMEVASQNLKAAMLQDVESIAAHVAELKRAMDAFEAEGMRLVKDSDQLLKDTEAELKRGGVPVFTLPSEIKPEFFDPPTLKPVDFTTVSSEEAQKKNSELEKLQAMAEALEGKKGGDADTGSGGISLEDLANQVKAIGGESSGSDAPASGGLDLAALAAQAEALSGKK